MSYHTRTKNVAAAARNNNGHRPQPLRSRAVGGFPGAGLNDCVLGYANLPVSALECDLEKPSVPPVCGRKGTRGEGVARLGMPRLTKTIRQPLSQAQKERDHHLKR